MSRSEGSRPGGFRRIIGAPLAPLGAEDIWELNGEGAEIVGELSAAVGARFHAERFAPTASIVPVMLS